MRELVANFPFFLSEALIHDLAESIVGDITPYCGISKEEKKQREMDAMQEIAKLIEPQGQRLLDLFNVSNCTWTFVLF